jgi:tRNA-splicing ligase RtcB
MSNFKVYNGLTGGLIKAWVEGVEFDSGTLDQLKNTACLPFVYKWLAAMPDAHLGKGSTVGSVIPTKGAIIPAAVGVDIGCGMMATRTTLKANDLPDNLNLIRTTIEKACPHGRESWSNKSAPKSVDKYWAFLNDGYNKISKKFPKIAPKQNPMDQLGTLGGGNHFIEVCIDENEDVWFMLHSGSRGVGNRIGSFFIEKAKIHMERNFIRLPDKDLAYFPENTEMFNDYFEALMWAQDYAKYNREVMMENLVVALKKSNLLPQFLIDKEAVSCHHNYVARENHFGENILVTRKGAVRAREGDLGIIPGSMGAKSFIVRGKGNLDSFCSCSHGAGRKMSRSKAKLAFTVEDHAKATKGVECRKDESVLDETPGAYKDIDAVMNAQKNLVDIVHTLKQVVCVKG